MGLKQILERKRLEKEERLRKEKEEAEKHEGQKLARQEFEKAEWMRKVNEKAEDEKFWNKKFNKDELILFSKENDDEFSFLGEKSKQNIRNNKQYCLMGIINNDKNRIKDIITGKVYEIISPTNSNEYSIMVGDDCFKSVEMKYDLTPDFPADSIYSFTFYRSAKNDLAILGNKTIKKLNSQLKNSHFQGCYEVLANYICTRQQIKNMIDGLNDEIHERYLDNIESYNNEINKEENKKAAKLTYEEKDF